MKINFKVLKLKESSKYYESLKRQYERAKASKNFSGRKSLNEFILVGSEIVDGEEWYKVHQLTDRGLVLICDFNLDEIVLPIPKKEFTWDGDSFNEIDIPKKHLTVDIIENIKKLNSLEV